MFYFKRKEFLLIETLRYHYDEYDAVWRGAVAAAGADPLDKLMALIFADLDPTLCTPRNLTLWNSFWGETAARPQYRIICEEHAARREVMVRLCGEVKSPIVVEPWKPKSVADALDIMTDGMWTRMHIEPSHMSLDEGRRLVARFLVTVFPSEAARIQPEPRARHARHPDPRYDCLFEPVRLGPVTARNRFYQVPHCSGMGWKRPRMLAAMRGVKAEGGWGVVCTEYCSVHPTSDDGAYPFARLWDTDDIRDHALMTEAVHAHGALAGVELWLGGSFIANLDTRVPPLGVISRPPTNVDVHHPVQSRRLDRSDIADIRRWQADAARRAVEAGFDIVYVYATHGYLVSEFLDSDTNDRTDEYGGSLENRYRIVRELIDVTRDAVAGKAAVAVRYAADMADPESFDAFGAMAELPDLWDLNVHDYGVEMGVSRFTGEAALQEHVRRARAMTAKPVVAVGRFTSPDTMARVVREGVQDLIGAARPSIADPFLPKKIEEGRIEDIRECIGCNICYAHNTLGVPIRCTQNPTMGEEHRRGWHPERVPRMSGYRGGNGFSSSGPAPPDWRRPGPWVSAAAR